MEQERWLDIAVAGRLKLKILGKAPCVPGYCKSDSWELAYDGDGQMQPVYLQNCFCDDPLEDEPKYFGHVISCLEVVPFYHQDDTLTRRALEQICNERKLWTEIIRYSEGIWRVRLWHGWVEKSRASNAKLTLAICKALAGLESDE